MTTVKTTENPDCDKVFIFVKKRGIFFDAIHKCSLLKAEGLLEMSIL